MIKLYGEYFYGNKASDYAIENGYLDYATLAKAFDAVLNNSIVDIGYWDMVSGTIDNSEAIEELEERIEELEEEKEEAGEENLSDIEAEISELEEEIEELENEQDDYPEIYQYYIVSESGAEILQDINEIVFYNTELDMFIWGVTHFGTSWSYVLTNIRLNCGKDAYK